ncbi:MAG TPA: hypothetical protein VL972_03375 [Solirubrobacteraceae bacterium]|nr:hypothetical protein [Solirubrobacteraceae bacterium]
MYVYSKSHTWETPTICWVYEGEGCPGLGNFQGPFVKEAKGKITYYGNGPFGEPEVAVFGVTKVKKSHPAIYIGTWYLYGEDYGTVIVET